MTKLLVMVLETPLREIKFILLLSKFFLFHYFKILFISLFQWVCVFLNLFHLNTIAWVLVIWAIWAIKILGRYVPFLFFWTHTINKLIFFQFWVEIHYGVMSLKVKVLKCCSRSNVWLIVSKCLICTSLAYIPCWDIYGENTEKNSGANSRCFS